MTMTHDERPNYALARLKYAQRFHGGDLIHNANFVLSVELDGLDYRSSTDAWFCPLCLSFEFREAENPPWPIEADGTYRTLRRRCSKRRRGLRVCGTSAQ
jgi:hypothetical protein